MSSDQVAYARKRRSSRIEKAIPLAVQGVDASRAPFREGVTTVAISCHGCSYQMKHEVLPVLLVILDMGQRANGYSDWPARARVKWIERLNTASNWPTESPWNLKPPAIFGASRRRRRTRDFH